LTSFASGIIFGAIFSLLVNIITIQVQETIQKQRVLEAIENEIVENAIQSNFIINNNTERIKNNEKPNYYMPIQKYSDEVWGTSEALKYIIHLDPETQGKLYSYYSVIIRNTNLAIDQDRELSKEKLGECYFDFEKTLTKEKTDLCSLIYIQILKNGTSSATLVGDHSFELLKSFHPTQDRLKNSLLRLLMGNKSIRILSGK
jgi:hypothetical protein